MDRLAYHAYTSCIILTYGFVVIDPSRFYMCIRSNFDCLVRSSDTVMVGEFDPEAFKVQLKEELFAETRSMMRKIMEEITKLIKEKQPMQSTDSVDLDTEISIRERKEDDMTVLADLVGQKNMGQIEDVEQSD